MPAQEASCGPVSGGIVADSEEAKRLKRNAAARAARQKKKARIAAEAEEAANNPPGDTGLLNNSVGPEIAASAAGKDAALEESGSESSDESGGDEELAADIPHQSSGDPGGAGTPACGAVRDLVIVPCQGVSPVTEEERRQWVRSFLDPHYCARCIFSFLVLILLFECHAAYLSLAA